MLSDAEVKERFFQLERIEKTFSFKLKGISVYHLLRFSIEMQLRYSFAEKVEKKSQHTIGKKIAGKLKRLLSTPAKQTSIDHYFDKIEEADASPFLFVGTCAWVNEEGANVDLYDIIEHYAQQKIKVNFIQPKYDRRPFPSKSNYYSSFLPLSTTLKIDLTERQKIAILGFLEHAGEVLQVDLLSKQESHTNYIATVLKQAEELEKYIRQLKVEYVFARSVYTEPWVSVACLNAEVKLVEVQHGVVGEDNIYYQSALSTIDLKRGDLIMPDYILTIGEEWKKVLINQDSFFHENNIINVGETSFEITEPKTTLEEDAVVRVLFILQGKAFNQLLSVPNFIENFLLKYKEELKTMKLELVIRPHPNDIGEVEIFKAYTKQIKIEDSRAVSSIESIKKSDFVISATSMCLYEALAYCKTAISFSQFKGMTTNQEHISFVDTVEDLFALLKTDELKLKNRLSYLDAFNPATLDYFCHELEGARKLDNNE